MRDYEGVRSLLRTIGSAALGVGLGLAVLAAGFFISRMTLPDTTIVATGTNTPAPTPSRSPSPSPKASTAAPTVAPTVAPTASPAATAAPTKTLDPLVVTSYENGGRRFAAIVIPSGYTMTSPVAGTVTINLYQFIDGEVRVGSNLSDQPFYPYVTVTSSDRKIVLRPGALDADVKLSVKDGDKIAAGAALFSSVSTSASSWRTFYDRNVQAQVIASVTAVPSGIEVDPVPVFKR